MGVAPSRVNLWGNVVNTDLRVGTHTHDSALSIKEELIAIKNRLKIKIRKSKV